MLLITSTIDEGRDMIYFIQEVGDDGFIKIGYAADKLERRVTNMQTGNARQLCLIGVMPIGEKIDERRLHKQFKKHRVLVPMRGPSMRLGHRGEWFKPHADVLAFINALPPYPPPMDTIHEVAPLRFGSTNS